MSILPQEISHLDISCISSSFFLNNAKEEGSFEIGLTRKNLLNLFRLLAGYLSLRLSIGIAFALFSVPSFTLAADVEPFEPFDAASIVWPSPPEIARIAYVSSIHKPSDIKVNKGFFKRIVTFILGDTNETIIKPYGIAVDSRQRLIVSDSATAKVHIFDILRGKYKNLSSGGNFGFSMPIGVAVDINDNIYVSDAGSGKVLVFNSRGRFQFAIEGLIRPTGLAIDNDDHILYVVDTGAHNINIYDLRGTYIKTIGGRGSDDGEFNFPTRYFYRGTGRYLCHRFYEFQDTEVQ